MSDKNKSAEDLMRIARTSMLFVQPFFANLAMRLNLVEVKDENKSSGFRTAATDGRNLYYHEDFIRSLDKNERAFLMSHEVLHCVFNHLDRRFDRDPKIWNMAADYVINATLIESGMQMPKVGLYEEKYIGWSADDVYDDLIANGAEAKDTLDSHVGDDDFPGNNKDGDPSGQGQGKSGKACDGDGDEGGLSGESMDPKELEDFWKDSVAQAAAAAGAGNIPAGLRRLIDDFLEPKMDWREVIQVHLQSCVRSDYSWMRPNKRTFGSGITLPSMDMDDAIEIAIAIDTSGSVGEDMLKDFLSEVKGVMDQFSGYKIHIACFDTQVYNYACITGEDDLVEYELAGFGGTDFMAWWKFAADQDWIGDVDKVLFFTDGYPCGDWGIEDLAETIWIVHGGTNEGPFGTTVFYEDHKKG